MIPPCKGCTDRNAECHSMCGKYAEYTAWRDDQRRKKSIDRVYWDAVQDGMNKVAHYKARHKGANPTRRG